MAVDMTSPAPSSEAEGECKPQATSPLPWPSHPLSRLVVGVVGIGVLAPLLVVSVVLYVIVLIAPLSLAYGIYILGKKEWVVEAVGGVEVVTKWRRVGERLVRLREVLEKMERDERDDAAVVERRKEMNRGRLEEKGDCDDDGWSQMENSKAQQQQQRAMFPTPSGTLTKRELAVFISENQSVENLPFTTSPASKPRHFDSSENITPRSCAAMFGAGNLTLASSEGRRRLIDKLNAIIVDLERQEDVSPVSSFTKENYSFMDTRSPFRASPLRQVSYHASTTTSYTNTETPTKHTTNTSSAGLYGAESVDDSYWQDFALDYEISDPVLDHYTTSTPDLERERQAWKWREKGVTVLGRLEEASRESSRAVSLADIACDAGSDSDKENRDPGLVDEDDPPSFPTSSPRSTITNPSRLRTPTPPTIRAYNPPSSLALASACQTPKGRKTPVSARSGGAKSPSSGQLIEMFEQLGRGKSGEGSLRGGCGQVVVAAARVRGRKEGRVR
ncbi:hypothetical protein EX30DRAFT_398558 [Ascodesmis nigricans]|uniref:Uncharacterized protein n=1 Tax=Ascodesmis nigricans TaxID=341454 RepID=A0A4S2MRB2_9PEZI|nr:hypothetical protein EX30DRAFT_398558 [Ascodesmis nigricans]